jgi:hypothetical protein
LSESPRRSNASLSASTGGTMNPFAPGGGERGPSPPTRRPPRESAPFFPPLCSEC